MPEKSRGHGMPPRDSTCLGFTKDRAVEPLEEVLRVILA